MDKPFILHGGETEQAALHNRIAAIERIKFLSGVDLREKSTDYLKALDLEMWMRWYKNEPKNKKIDEDFCQRAATVVKAMEGDANPPVDEFAFAREFKNATIESIDTQSTVDEILQTQTTKEKKKWYELATLRIRTCWTTVSTRLRSRKQK